MQVKFFTLEGIDGSGKSSISKYIANYLTRRGIPFTCVESYLRDDDSMHLRNQWIHRQVPPLAILSCILELRKRVVERQIIPALLAGHVVISDRFNDSTYAYQQVGDRIPHELVQEAFNYQLDFFQIVTRYRDADGNELTQQQKDFLLFNLSRYKTIFLDIDITTSCQRMKGRVLDEFEKRPDDFFAALIAGFRRTFIMRGPEQGPPIVVDATVALDVVCSKIDKILEEHIVTKMWLT